MTHPYGEAWQPVAGRQGVWKHTANDDCCVAEFTAHECLACGERELGQRRVDLCVHYEAFVATPDPPHCGGPMHPVVVDADGIPQWTVPSRAERDAFLRRLTEDPEGAARHEQEHFIEGPAGILVPATTPKEKT